MLKRCSILLLCYALLSQLSLANDIEAVASTYFTQSHLALVALSPQLRSLESRFYSQRRGKRCVTLSGSITTDSGKQIDLQSLMPDKASCSGNKRLSVFLDSHADSTQRNSSAQQHGYDLHNLGFNVGADYRWRDTIMLGVAVGHQRSDSDLDAQLAAQEFDGYHLALYGSYLLTDNFSLDATYHYGRYDHTSTRRAGAQRFHSDTSSEQHSLSFGVDYRFHQHNLSVVPHMRVTLSTVELGAFDEKNTTGRTTYRIAQNTLHATYLRGGLDIAYAIPYSWGILTPMANVDIVRQVEHETRRLAVQGTDGQVWQLRHEAPKDAYVNMGLGLIAQIADNKTLYANYETQLFHRHVEHHSITAGLQFMF